MNLFGLVHDTILGYHLVILLEGAVLGPEEFAEGVAYGVKSLFGHAVGEIFGYHWHFCGMHTKVELPVLSPVSSAPWVRV